MLYFLDSANPDNNNNWRVKQLLSAHADPLAGAVVQTLFHAYGADDRVARFWVQVDDKDCPTAIVSLVRGGLTVADNPHSDRQELAEFLGFMGGFDRLSCSPGLYEQLGFPGQSRPLYAMVYEGIPQTPAADFSTITGQIPLKGLFALLCQGDEHFARTAHWDSWYVHTSHLLRHGLGFHVGITQNEALVAACGVYAQSASHAVLSGLVTRPNCRRQGYGRLLMACLIHQVQAMGKTPALYTVEESLCQYYQAMGFRPHGLWMEAAL